jgi:hypothetical protein
MSWKKTLPYFAWQSLLYARNFKGLLQIWRYRDRWSRSFDLGRNSVNDELPWLNFAAIDYLQQQPLADSKVFEFGGGGSTLFFCKKRADVTTVEDNAEWFKILTNNVAGKGYQQWKGFFVQPEPYTGNTKQRLPENPEDFMSGGAGLGHLSYEQYARSIDPFPEAYFDIILIVGRARPSCIQQAIPHLKPNGLLIVDNTERPYYLMRFSEIIAENFSVEMDTRGPVGYSPDFTGTTILRKKKG